MKLAEAKMLPNGLYRIRWTPNGTSLAAVGRTANGTPWLAPINWVSVLTDKNAGRVWRLVAEAQRIA